MATSGLTAPLPIARVVDGLAVDLRPWGAAFAAGLRDADDALDFCVVGFRTGALCADAFLAGTFLAGAFLAGVFFAGAFFTGTFLTGDFLAAALLLAPGLVAAFFVVALFVRVVAASVLFAVTVFFGVAFAAPDFFVEFFDERLAWEPDTDFAAAVFVAGLPPAAFFVAVFFICEPSCAEKPIPC